MITLLLDLGNEDPQDSQVKLKVHKRLTPLRLVVRLVCHTIKLRVVVIGDLLGTVPTTDCLPVSARQ